MDLALAAIAAGEVELEVRVGGRDPRHLRRRLRWQPRSAQVRVDDDAGGVDHRDEGRGLHPVQTLGQTGGQVRRHRLHGGAVAGAGALACVLDERPQLAHHERAAVPRFERPDLGTLERLLY